MAGKVIMVDDLPLLLPKPVVVVEEPLPLGAPDPPAKLESCANPIEGGSARKTEYTFFKKVSPISQEGLPEPEGMSLPRPRSKMAPRHCELPIEIWPRLMSVAFIGHALPPKESVT